MLPTSDRGVLVGLPADRAAGDAAVLLPTHARRQGMLLVGRQGMGKTHLLQVMIRQDIAQGRGLFVFDAHGDLVNELLSSMPAERAADVVLLDASDPTHAFGLNVFDCPDPADVVARQAASDRVIGLFKRVFAEGEFAAWGNRLEDVLYNLTEVFLDNPGSTLVEMLTFLSDAGFRTRLLVTVTQPEVHAFWAHYDQLKPGAQAALTGSTTNKLRRFAMHRLVRHIVGQPTTVDMRALLDTRKIVLIKLPVGIIGDEAVALLGTFLMDECLRAVLARADTHERIDVALYADECHRFAGQHFVKLLEEARKYAVANVLATQRIDKLGDARGAALGAVNQVVFQVVPEDARAVVGRFRLEPKPTPPVRQRQMRRIYDEHEEVVWDPPEAEREHLAVMAELGRLRAAFDSIPRGRATDFLPVPTRPLPGGGDVVSRAFAAWGIDAPAAFPPHITLALEAQLERAHGAHPALIEGLLAELGPLLAAYKRRRLPWFQPQDLPMVTGPWPANAATLVDLHSGKSDATALVLPAVDPGIAGYLAERRTALRGEIEVLEGRQAELYACRAVLRERVDTGLEEAVMRYSAALGRLAPVYEWVPGPLQSRSAAREALVERLSTLPPYHALVRIRSGEHESWQGELVPFDLGKLVHDVAQIERLRRQSWPGSYRPRAQVELEIRARQQAGAAAPTGALVVASSPALPASARRGPVRRREVVE